MNSQHLIPLLLAVGASILLPGCRSNGTSPSRISLLPAPESDVRLAVADVRIDGRSVNGSTISPGSGSSTLFTVTLETPADATRIARMQMDYTPHAEMGMMQNRSSVDCYDDGTHGDQVAGNGTYSLVDVDGHIGLHYEDCVSGTYVYTFHGLDTMGDHTNSLEWRVTVR